MQEHLNVITFRLCGLIVSIDDVRAMHLLKNASGVNGWRNRSIIRQNKRLGMDGNKREKRFDLDGYIAKVALLTELSIVCNVRKTWFRWKCTVLFVNKIRKKTNVLVTSTSTSTSTHAIWISVWAQRLVAFVSLSIGIWGDWKRNLNSNTISNTIHNLTWFVYANSTKWFYPHRGFNHF